MCNFASVPQNIYMALLLVYLFLSMGISFMCSILESVLMSTPISFITMREEEGSRVATRFKSYKEDTDEPLAAILSLNTIANTIGAAGIGRQATLVFGSEWFGLISIIVTILILVFSEIIPKTIGTTYWRNLMGVTATIIRVLIVCLYPLVMLVKVLTRLIARNDDDDITISREEVSAMANVAEEEGVFEEGENKVIQNLINLDDVLASDAMTPRVVAAVAKESMKVKEFYKDNSYLHHSRIPVYSDNPDYITGYVLRSDVLEKIAQDKFDVRLSDIRRDVPFYNQDTPLSDVWEDFVGHKEQISIIIDEYGCFHGILTLEDVIETILGSEIVDENDEFKDMQQYARERWQTRLKK